MEFDKELIEAFNNIREEKKEIKKKLKTVSIKESELNYFINQCAIFDESIIFAISQLLTYKEGKRFMPIIYKKFRHCCCYPPMYSEDTFIGIAPDENITDFVMSKSDNIDRFLGLGLGYEIYHKSTGNITEYKYDTAGWIINYYNFCDYERDDKNFITFAFLLNNFGIRNACQTTYSRYDFYDYEYVQNFIIYLFNLQVQNKGRILTYDEIHKALNDFLALEENKTKTKKK